MEIFPTLLNELKTEYPKLDISSLERRIKRFSQNHNYLSNDKIYHILKLYSLENICKEEPDWTFVASKIQLSRLYESALENRGNFDFYSLINSLVEEDVYDKFLLEKYSKSEIDELGKVIDFKKDRLFNYIGLQTLDDRYLTKTKNEKTMELPQERFMIISMCVMQNEKTDRLTKIKEAYWALSNQYMIVASPTLSNAGKKEGQLSSCFIDTIQDDLKGIYNSNTDTAQISKNGGGVGAYLGKIRSKGSKIRGLIGASGGIIPWMKQINTTAVNVDQLGKRRGAITVYLDCWHKDIFHFLDAKLNNGDERQRTHDIFTGVCIPDLFMEAVENRSDWYLFDPYEVKEVMGFSLEDYYDEEIGKGQFRTKYQQCVENEELSKVKVQAIEIMKRIMISQLEDGNPFMFYRDTVNRDNPNKHAGFIYCSNLCTEITQNQSPTYVTEEFVNKDGKIITVKEPGDFVVCNLSSISLARAVQDDVLERLIPIQVRMLDNVIDVNNLPVLQAQITNNRYRAIGLGTFGYHHLLALKGIHWESEEAVTYSDKLYEKIAFLTIRSSMELSREKGSYPLFEGSDWQTGKYFVKKGYTERESEYNWNGLMGDVQTSGLRNGYLMAVAPNATTSLIAGSTASIDPIFRKEYSEEKKDYKIPVTAPDISEETEKYYKSAYLIDHKWSIKQNAARQRHIDQSISFNFYVQNDIRAKEILELHISSWKSGLKTTYYVRSTSQKIEE